MRLAAVLAALICCPVIAAATITVANLNDAGTGSLREAITQANTDVGPDDIVFATTINLPGTIRLQTALPDITEDLTITGPATDDLVIERDTSQPAFRLLTITAGTVAISHLWLGNGSVVGAAGVDAEGGCIHNAGALTITACILYDCTAQGGAAVTGNGGAARGGAIFSSGALTLQDVFIDNCQAIGGGTDDGLAFGGSAQGGGIYIYGPGADLVMLESGISGCSARGGGNTAMSANRGSGGGGAITCDASLIQDSGISNCETTSGGSAFDGGAVRIIGATALRRSSITGCTGGAVAAATALNMENCTLSGNQGQQFGGMLVESGAVVSLRYCTLTLNAGATAGGVQVVSGTLQVEGTIIAGNSGASPDVDGAATDLDNNLIGNDTGSTGFTVSLLVGTQLNPIPPLLDSLHDFGMTGIHVPQWGSFAIDRGGANAPFDDQRRANRLFGGAPDIGAVEFIVNQRPSFTAGNSVKVKGDGGNHTVQGWATAISAGAQWEAGQQLRFVVSGPRGAFESGPNIDEVTGDLRFRPEKDEHGTFVFEVVLLDDGGTANGGADTSTARQLVIELERDEDDPFGADCSATTHGGLPVLLAGAGGVAAILRRRKVRPARSRAAGFQPL